MKDNKSTKVLKTDGPREIVEVDKALAWNFLFWSGAIPIKLIVDENAEAHTVRSFLYSHKKKIYILVKLNLGFDVLLVVDRENIRKKKMMFIKVFEGNWKVDPIFVDEERFCKNRSPKSREEYKRCSGGEGKLASRVTMEQRFQPCTLLNLPPVSWYIRGKTIKTTKTLLTMIQEWCAKIQKAQCVL